MNKKLLSVAMAAALGVPAGSAMALDGAKGSSLEIYGRFQVEMAFVGSDSKNANTDPNYLVDDGMGRIGFFATEKLGNGMVAFGRLEQKTLTSETDWAARDRYVGIKGNWGTFLAGRHGSPYKITGGVKVDPFVATTMEARNGGGMSSGAMGHTSFASDILAYASPNWNGFSFIVAFNPENNDQIQDGGYFESNYWSAGAQYKNGPIWIWGAYSDNGGGEGGSWWDQAKAKRWKLGAKGTMGNHSLAIQYEDANGYSEKWNNLTPISKGYCGASCSSSIDANDAKFLWIAYIFKAGNNTAMLSYGKEEYDSSYEGSGDINIWTIAARHNFSKTFSVFGGWKYQDLDKDMFWYINETSGSDMNYNRDVTINTVSIGMRKDFSI